MCLQSFFRFPGGNMLEGPRNDSWWDWKDTLGPLRYRKGHPGPWGYETTMGLGLVEYLEWAEDMNMKIGTNPSIIPSFRSVSCVNREED